MRGDSAERGLPHRTMLELLGVHVLVRCAHQACRDGIAEYFSAAVVNPWRTPDVIVDCEWETADRYLFRARPSEHPDPLLYGVRVRTKEQPDTGEWSSKGPPLPPMSVEPYVNRFVALHAGAVRTPEGVGLMMIGDKGTGKTTVSVALVNQHGCGLLTDETVFIHRRSRIIEPFPRAVGVADGYDTECGKLRKRPRSANAVCRRVESVAAVLGHMAFLEPIAGMEGASLQPVSVLEAFRLLLHNQREAGTSADEGVLTLMALAREIPAVVCRYGSHQDLLEIGGPLLGLTSRRSSRA